MAAHRSLLACLLCAVALVASSARAQTGEELDRARALFEDALRDEKAGNNDEALEKFRRVAAVRDTAQVEFRIGSCLEALGRKREALKAYGMSASLGRGDAQVRDVVDAADDHMSKLAATMGKLAVDVRGPNADRAEVRVDGELLGAEELHGPVLLEEGTHALDVRAPGANPAHMTIQVAAGARLPVSVQLAPAPVETPKPPPEPVVSSHARRNTGIVLLSAGAASALGAGLALLFRHDTIATIQTDCPGDVCPISRRDEIEGLRTTAFVLGPVAAIAGGLALAGLAAGITLIALGPPRTSPAAWLTLLPGGAGVGGRF